MATKIKVSQATIDKIKKMGMTKALAGAKTADPEMREALTRMYGIKRVTKAGFEYTPTTRRGSGAPAKKKVVPSMYDGKGPNAAKLKTPSQLKKEAEAKRRKALAAGWSGAGTGRNH